MDFKINLDAFNTFPYLESERLKFREMNLSDAEPLLIIRRNDDVMKYLDTNKFASIEDSEKFINSISGSFKNTSGINWAIVEKASDNFIGYAGLWRIDHDHCRAEIGYALSPEYWRKGFMTESLKEIIKFGFGELRVHSIEANINPENIASIKLLEKVGFIKEAYFRENFLFNNEFKDSIIYSLLERDFK